MIGDTKANETLCLALHNRAVGDIACQFFDASKSAQEKMFRIVVREA
jgi:hypothetical protein